MSESTSSFEELSSDDIATLVRKMKKAGDDYAKMNAMEPYVSWGDRQDLLWHLTRTEAYETWSDPLLWRQLNEGFHAAGAEDVAQFLSKVESFDAGDYSLTGLVDWWPLMLDEMVCKAYADDPAPFNARYDDFAEPVKRGFALVLRRFGNIERDDLDDDVIESLAHEQVHNYGLPTWVYMMRDGKLEHVELSDHEGKKPAFDEFIALFGSQQDWAQSILREALDVEYRLNVGGTIEAWKIADRDQLLSMLTAVNTGEQSASRLYTLFLEERDDAPGDLLWLADELLEAQKEWVAEVCAACAILTLDDAGEPLPDDAAAYISGRSIFSSSKRHDYGNGLERLVDVLQKLPEQTAQDHIIDQLEDKYPNTDMFLLLQAWPDDKNLVDRALDALMPYVEERSPNFPGMDSTAHGLGFIGESHIDTYVERLEATDNDILDDTLHRAIIYALADMVERDGDFDEKYDPYVRFSGWKSKDTDPYYFGHYLAPDLRTIAHKMPEARIEKILIDQIEADHKQWGRTLQGVSVRQTEALLDCAFEALATSDHPATGGRGWNWMEKFLRSLNDDSLAKLGAALSRSEAPDFHNAVKKVLGDDRYDEILAEYGASSAADDTHAAKISRLSKNLFDKREELTPTTICIFERLDEAPKKERLHRVGGRPVGVDDDRWPHKDGDEDLPMSHMITIDINEVAPLRARLGDDVRAISLFVHNPDFNEAWTPYNADTQVLLLSDEDIEGGEFAGEMPDGDDNPKGISVEEVEVPAELFELRYDDDDDELRQIRDLVYSSHAYSGGQPLWLQNDESPGSPFLFQFDEGLVWMNLGDCGVMYVFQDTAFWQCH